MKVVVVEDQEDMRRLIQLSLDSEPRLEIAASASNARDAIEAVRRVQPDCVILDQILLGELTGMQTIPTLRSIRPELKIVVLSSHDLGLEAGLDPEVNRFMQKKDLNDLASTVAELVGLK